MVRLIVDNRERNFEVLEGLSGQGAALEFAQLPVGDYVLSDRICVERKTSSDLENSIMNARLFDQLERLKSSFQKPILVIEESPEGYRLNSNVILGTMLKAYVDYGVQVIMSRSPQETAEVLFAMAKREQEHKDHEPRLVGMKKAYTEYQWQLLIISSIPGVGPTLAKRLLSRFKSVKNIANSTVQELSKVEKIGNKKAARIYEILNAVYTEEAAR